MALQRFHRQHLTATPWKNGGGLTREIACYPANADMDDFLWRMSIATIAADGPFSRFDGVERVITLLDGPGVRLRSGDGAIDHSLSQPLQPFGFPGEAGIQGELLGGPCDDFNIMTRRDAMRAQVTLVTAATTLAPAPHGALLATTGEWLIHEPAAGCDATLILEEGLWWSEQALQWTLTPQSPDAALLAVRIWPAGIGKDDPP